MEKLKYYYLAVKNGAFQKLVSPNRTELDKFDSVFGYDSLGDIPVNPIVVGGVIRSMTTAELEAKALADKANRTQFTIKSIGIACKAIDVENGNTILFDKLNAVLSVPFTMSLLVDSSGMVDLEDEFAVEAMSPFTEDEINAIKLKV